METKFRLPVLEECAKVLLAAPNVVTKDVRKEAEKVFLEFRKTAFPYETCRFLLENSRNNFVQFQAVCTIKTSILREWTCLPTTTIEQLRLFLLNYVTTNLSLTPYVREEIFRALALIIKRGILDTENTTSSKIFDEQLIACGLLTALLNEFSNHNKTCGTGFTWDFHSRCKLHFEAYHLHQTLLFTLQILNNIVQLTTPYSGDELLVVTRVLSLADDILHWTFLTPTDILCSVSCPCDLAVGFNIVILLFYFRFSQSRIFVVV
ncbi:XPO4 [Bugula neritina]|uniref:Exportin-4 n=1 Tax=Bugula neritina TaxID=10212 RepID=A0A7J7KPN5_BUGNE|nr:XPO4 [Bugula neritina]